jgi:hypothetical protein
VAMSQPGTDVACSGRHPATTPSSRLHSTINSEPGRSAIPTMLAHAIAVDVQNLLIPAINCREPAGLAARLRNDR